MKDVKDVKDVSDVSDVRLSVIPCGMCGTLGHVGLPNEVCGNCEGYGAFAVDLDAIPKRTPFRANVRKELPDTVTVKLGGP